MATLNKTGSSECDRELFPAVRKGWRRKCPSCGQGPLMDGYLKIRKSCSSCNAQLHHHRADDGPAYLTILIVGHITMPLLHYAFVKWRPDPYILLAIFGVGCIVLSLYLLPRLKGVVVAFQWARYMHGFSDAQQPVRKQGSHDRR
ncbi:MAG: DUF983 domain-containing protein [Marinovum sp.]|nr:DUF983 domain-containing protein [Marinovum sp.]MBT4871519.1 DUF983 domain-containing protein [Marinovum sp.]MBT6098406.1 DUF983 domain-containing protein [Marinovum sp.]MBT7907853.1 DUF983 domain-containing protein [Marinovum sp.]